MNILLHSEDDTAVLGAIIARAMHAGDTLLLAGALGAGKTTLAQAIIKTLMPAASSPQTKPKRYKSPYQLKNPDYSS